MGLHYRLSEEQFPLTASKSPAADHTPPWHPSPAWPLSPPAPSSVSRLPVLPLGPSSPPPARGRTLTAPPSSSELVLHRWSRWIRSWYWLSVRLAHHWLCQEPQPQAATLLLCHSWIRPVRGHGSVLFDDGVPAVVCILDAPRVLTECCSTARDLVLHYW